MRLHSSSWEKVRIESPIMFVIYTQITVYITQCVNCAHDDKLEGINYTHDVEPSIQRLCLIPCQVMTCCHPGVRCIGSSTLKWNSCTPYYLPRQRSRISSRGYRNGAVCLCVCPCVNTLMAEPTDVWSQNLVQGFTLMTSRTRSMFKIIGQRSRSSSWKM